MSIDAVTSKVYQTLMPKRIRDILIVSSPYDAFVMEEDGGIIEHVFTTFRGLSLVEPPRFTTVTTSEDALNELHDKKFDLVIIMPRFSGMDVVVFGKEVKRIIPNLPVVLLVQSRLSLNRYMSIVDPESIDRIFIWSGNRTIMWAIVKWIEDEENVEHDTKLAMVRVLILVEDSPYHYSSLLPILYDSIVQQSQAIVDDTLNEEHRLLKLRARPKILLASNYENAVKLCDKYRPYLLGVFSDTRYHMNGKEEPLAGVRLLEKIKYEMPHVPILLLSTEGKNRESAIRLEAYFQDKNSKTLHQDIKNFLVDHMGFGDFIFRLPSGKEVGRASNLLGLEKKLKTVPRESLLYHVALNHFSSWLMARGEIDIALKFRGQRYSNFQGIDEIRDYLVASLHERRMRQQEGVVSSFTASEFDSEQMFLKIGDGSLGGKARGLAFMAKYLQRRLSSFEEFENVIITIPQTLVLTTDCFDKFIEENNLSNFAQVECSDEVAASRFINAKLPTYIEECLRSFLEVTTHPLAVRSSSLLEDSRDEPYAGLYKTYMIPNNHPDIEEQVSQLSIAIKLVYASIFYEGPRAYSRNTQHRTEEEKMGVVIQQIIGRKYGDYFYPAISGTVQSYNYYPFSNMKADEGIAQIAIGLGKIVVEGGQALRFSPKFPQSLPQFSKVDDILKNSQKYFYALKLNYDINDLWLDEDVTLARREIEDANDEIPVKMLSSSFSSEDYRLRDYYDGKTGSPVVTFASVLKYDKIKLPQVLSKLIELGREGFGCELEMEFAINLTNNPKKKHEFVLLQARPMTIPYDDLDVEITEEDQKKAICYSTNALGIGVFENISDIILVKPDSFSFKTTLKTVKEISDINVRLDKENRKYLLVGPGRWGTSDHSLGVPVSWQDISAVGAIVEATTKTFRADPSQGTHFFQNITSLGIIYLTVYGEKDYIDWSWFMSQEYVHEAEFVRHIRLSEPLKLKISGKKNQGAILHKSWAGR